MQTLYTHALRDVLVQTLSIFALWHNYQIRKGIVRARLSSVSVHKLVLRS